MRSKLRGSRILELLAAISIIGILMLFVFGALRVSPEQAKRSRALALVVRLRESVTDRWESYVSKRRREADVLQILAEIENSHIPPLDEEPLTYPDPEIYCFIINRRETPPDAADAPCDVAEQSGADASK